MKRAKCFLMVLMMAVSLLLWTQCTLVEAKEGGGDLEIRSFKTIYLIQYEVGKGYICLDSLIFGQDENFFKIKSVDVGAYKGEGSYSKFGIYDSEFIAVWEGTCIVNVDGDLEQKDIWFTYVGTFNGPLIYGWGVNFVGPFIFIGIEEYEIV